MPFNLLVKDASTSFKNGDVVDIFEPSFTLTLVEDYSLWIASGRTHETWPQKFYIIEVTNPEMNGTTSTVQGLLAPYEIDNPDAPEKRRYNLQLTGTYLTDIETVYRTAMDWATLESFIIDRLA